MPSMDSELSGMSAVEMTQATGQGMGLQETSFPNLSFYGSITSATNTSPWPFITGPISQLFRPVVLCVCMFVQAHLYTLYLASIIRLGTPKWG